ncbi:MAG: DUF3883 domain-containing protein [Bacteroidales bacterium]|jgi:hypothetical protein|nr:DUF3883 domain-containing protein [Bacteroidales bacterium]
MQIEALTKNDLKLINELSSRNYTSLSLSSNSSEEERHQFKNIKEKLKKIANYFSDKYKLYGPFQTNVSPEANPMSRGNTLNYVWSTFFKGTKNKQYSAQISFVIDKQVSCLNIGFYFGSASAHSLHIKERDELESTLNRLGTLLSDAIKNNPSIKTRYNDLFDLGFSAYINGENTLPDLWIDKINYDPKNSNITIKVFPNESGYIELLTLDFYVSQVIFLMTAIESTKSNQKTVPPLTSEQWAKRAERKAKIGSDGELFVWKKECEKLRKNGSKKEAKHVALESIHYGYDILSYDNNENEIYIEVKTTTRQKKDPKSKQFFLSSNEYNTYLTNKSKYKLYRVYEIENEPHFEELNLENVNKQADGYIIEY